jgi:hypothetical protein
MAPIATGLTKGLLIFLLIRSPVIWTHRPHAWWLGRMTYRSNVLVVFFAAQAGVTSAILSVTRMMLFMKTPVQKTSTQRNNDSENGVAVH